VAPVSNSLDLRLLRFGAMLQGHKLPAKPETIPEFQFKDALQLIWSV